MIGGKMHDAIPFVVGFLIALIYIIVLLILHENMVLIYVLIGFMVAEVTHIIHYYMGLLD